MSWEIFERQVIRHRTAAVTLNARGRIVFNRTATGLLKKEAVEYVLLMWDKEAASVGFKPTTLRKDPRAYRIGYNKKGEWAAFAAKTFMDYIEYDRAKTRSFPLVWNEADSIFQAKLPEECLKGRQRSLIAELPTSSRKQARN